MSFDSWWESPDDEFYLKLDCEMSLQKLASELAFASSHQSLHFRGKHFSHLIEAWATHALIAAIIAIVSFISESRLRDLYEMIIKAKAVELWWWTEASNCSHYKLKLQAIDEPRKTNTKSIRDGSIDRLISTCHIQSSLQPLSQKDDKTRFTQKGNKRTSNAFDADNEIVSESDTDLDAICGFCDITRWTT